MAKAVDITALVLCFIESGALGGALFGWPSLTYVLQRDGIYSFLCDHNNSLNDSFIGQAAIPISEPCDAQKVHLSIGYTVAICTLGIGAVPVGWIFDRFGLRVTRTLGTFVGILSSGSLLLVDHGQEWMLFLGAACLGLSCYILIMSSSHIAGLAGKKTSTVIALYFGALNTGFTFQGVKLAYDAGIGRRIGLGFVCSLWTIVLFTTWFLLPPYKVVPVNEDILNSSQVHAKSRHRAEGLGSHSVKDAEIKKETLRTYMFRWDFVLLVYFFCATHVRVTFIIASYDTWISGLVNGEPEKVSSLIDALAYGTIAGTLTTPVAGVLIDVLRARTPLQGEVDTGGYLVPALVLVLVFLIAASVPTCFTSQAAVYVHIAFFSVVKPWIYSIITTYVSLLSPAHMFGSVLGVMNFISGIAAFTVNAYMMWLSHTGNILPVTIVHLVSIGVAFSLPLKIQLNSYHKLMSIGDANQINKDIAFDTKF